MRRSISSHDVSWHRGIPQSGPSICAGVAEAGPRRALGLYPPPSSVAEDADGALLALVYWPVTETSDGSTTEWPRTRLVRIAPDGSRAFVPPFGELEPGSLDTRINVDDEILPLPDGSILFTRYNAIDRLRPDGTIVRFAGTGR
jgi:hypothetical protein